ncbi:hypothetical protein [Treponema sp. R6D11]
MIHDYTCGFCITNNLKLQSLLLWGMLFIGAHDKDIGVYLIPGFNDVPADEWEKVKSTLQGKLDAKILLQYKVEKTGKAGGKVEKFAESLDDFEDKFLETVIPNCFHIATLNKWKEKAEKESTRLLLLNQIARMESENPKAEK